MFNDFQKCMYICFYFCEVFEEIVSEKPVNIVFL